MNGRTAGAVVAAVTLLATGCSAPIATPIPRWGTCPPGTPGASGVVAQRDPAQQCTTVTVPVDYSRPNGATIEVTVSRIPASSGHAKGSLLLHPGGPGGPGLDHPSEMLAQLPRQIRQNYDLLGIDDRGVGTSAPVHCGLSDTDRAAAAADPFPAPDGSPGAPEKAAHTIADACAANAGPMLPYLTTRNVARDINQIRMSLGLTRMSYYGTSYGTYLGEVLAVMFPTTTDHVVLDSTDPPGGTAQAVTLWGTGITDAFPALATWLATHDSTLHAGNTVDAVRRSYATMLTRLDAHPATVGNHTIDGNAMRSVVKSAMENPKYYPLVGRLWATLTGAPHQAPAAGTPTLPTIIPDNFLSAQFAIMCGDGGWPVDTGQFPAAIAADRTANPLGAGIGGNVWPCTYWHHQPLEPLTAITADGPSNVLLLQNRFDPSTPMTGAQQTLAALGTRAKMVTINTTGHGVDLTNGCIGAALTTFLDNATVPVSDCPARP